MGKKTAFHYGFTLARLDDPAVGIVGTSDTVLCTAMASGFIRPDGSAWFDHDGETKVHWDSQEGITRNGESMFEDENGEDVPMSNVGAFNSRGKLIPLTEQGEA